MPRAVVADVSSISGACTWCAVARLPRLLRVNATNSSAPRITLPPACEVSLRKSSVKIPRHASQSLVSRYRQ